MIPAEEVVAAALKTALTAYAADETAFKSVYHGYPAARREALWEDIQDADKQPVIRIEFYRDAVKIPLWLVSTSSIDPETTPAGEVFAGSGEMVGIVVVGRFRGEVNDMERLVRASMLVTQTAALQSNTGFNGFTFMGRSKIAPMDAEPLGLSPQDLFACTLSYKVQSEFEPDVPDNLTPAVFVDALAVIREGYTDESIPLDGGVEFDRVE